MADRVLTALLATSIPPRRSGPDPIILLGLLFAATAMAGLIWWGLT